MYDPLRALSFFALILLILGLLFNLKPDLPKIPGDIYIRKGPVRLYIPLVSAIVLSIILTLIFNFFKK